MLKWWAHIGVWGWRFRSRETNRYGLNIINKIYIRARKKIAYQVLAVLQIASFILHREPIRFTFVLCNLCFSQPVYFC